MGESPPGVLPVAGLLTPSRGALRFAPNVSGLPFPFSPLQVFCSPCNRSAGTRSDRPIVTLSTLRRILSQRSAVCANPRQVVSAGGRIHLKLCSSTDNNSPLSFSCRLSVAVSLRGCALSRLLSCCVLTVLLGRTPRKDTVSEAGIPLGEESARKRTSPRPKGWNRECGSDGYSNQRRHSRKTQHSAKRGEPLPTYRSRIDGSVQPGRGPGQ